MTRIGKAVVLGIVAPWLCATGGPTPEAAAQEMPAITSAVARPSIQSRVVLAKAIDPSRDILVRADDVKVAGSIQTPVTSFDERVRSFASDPGGPTILVASPTSGFDPNQPANGVIGPFSGTSDVSQRTTVTATDASVRVQSTARIACNQTRIPPNALMGVSTSGSAVASVTVQIARPCRYELSVSLATDPDDRFFGQGRTEVSLSGSDPELGSGNYFSDRAEILPGFAGNVGSRSIRLTGVFQPGFVQMNLAANLDRTGPAGVASWTATLVLDADDPGNEIRWVGASGASFGVASNWDPQVVPGSSGPGGRDTAVFDRRGNFVIDFGTAKRAAASQTQFRHAQPGGNVTFRPVLYTLESMSEATPSVHVDGESTWVLDRSVVTSNFAVVGDERPGASAVRVEGPGALWDCQRTLRVGSFGDPVPYSDGSQVTVRDRADLVTADVVIGAGPQGGLVSVEGPDASWTAGDVLVGFLGPGRAEIRSGAQATMGDVTISGLEVGLQAEENFGAFLFVSGASDDGVRSRCVVGDVVLRGAGARLQAEFGGEISVHELSVGTGPADPYNRSECVVYAAQPLVGGAQRRPSISCFDAFVGRDGGRGLLLVIEGDFVAIGSLTVGDGLVMIGDITETIAPSTVTVLLDLTVGSGGFGTVELLENSILDCGPAVVGPVRSEGTGGRVQFLERATGGAPARWRVRGDLTVGRDDGYGRVTMGGDGTIAVEEDFHLGTNGSLEGSGTVTVGGVMQLDGTIEAGLAIGGPGTRRTTRARSARAKPAAPTGGTLTIEGDLLVGPTGVVRAVAAGPQASRLVVTGDAQLGGTLVLQFQNGYAPRAGESFDVMRVDGAVTGAFDAVEARGLLPGAQFDLAQSGTTWTATAAADTAALPTVSVKASPKKLFEKKAKKKGTLVFKRSGDVTAPLTASCVVGGTAVNGDDCVQLLETVTFPARKRTVKVQVEVANDRAPEDPETLEVTVLPGPGATPAAVSAARLTIVDDDGKLPR